MPIEAAARITAECELRTAEIPTVFDKLLFLTSVQRWLGAKHRQLFNEWLSSPLEEQYAMLAPRYHDAAETGELPAEAFALTSFSKLIPAGGVEEGPRTLFYSNLDHILDILKIELPISAQPRPLAFTSPGSTPEWLFHTHRFGSGQPGATGLLPIREDDKTASISAPTTAPSGPHAGAAALGNGVGNAPDNGACTNGANSRQGPQVIGARTPQAPVAFSSRIFSTWNLDRTSHNGPLPGNLPPFNLDPPVAANGSRV